MSVKLIQGAVREKLKELPENSVHCVVTSPPYFGLRSYLPDGHPDKPVELGTEQTPDAYVATLVGIFGEVRHVLRDDGTVWLNLGDSYASVGGKTQPHRDSCGGFSGSPGTRTQGYAKAGGGFIRPNTTGSGVKPKDLLGIPWRVAFALRADGWYLRSAIVWHKPSPIPESCTDRPTSSYEMVFLLTKRPTYFYDAESIREDNSPSGKPFGNKRNVNAKVDASRNDINSINAAGRDPGAYWGLGRNCRNVWTIAAQPYDGAHFATMPPQLAEKCILAGTSEAGACPHCGAPWERIVEKGEPDLAHQVACGGSLLDGSYDGLGRKDYQAAGAQNPSDVKRRILEGMRTRRTAGWQPTCSCPARPPVPCTVLDPFAGTGTTGFVADRLGRDAVLIELSEAYCKQIRQRVQGNSLFSVVI